MLTPVLQNLLILQDRDLKRHALESQLKAVPDEVAQVERKIASEKAAIETARSRSFDQSFTDVRIVEGELGERAGALGALAVARDRARDSEI